MLQSYLKRKVKGVTCGLVKGGGGDATYHAGNVCEFPMLLAK